MRVNIKGDDVAPEHIAEALRKCEKDHGLKIKGATVYIRFEDRLGRTVEPMQDGQEITRDFEFRKPKASPLPQPKEIITAREMIEMCQKAARRSLSSPEMKKLIELEKVGNVERKLFKECLDRTLLNTGTFSIHYFVKLIEHRCV